MHFKLSNILSILLGRKCLFQLVSQMHNLFNVTLILLLHLIIQVINGLAIFLNQSIELSDRIL